MSQKTKVEVTVSNRTIARTVGIVVATLVAISFLRHVSHVLELIFIALFLGLALNPAVSWISRRLKLKSRAAATGVAYVGVIIVLGFFTSLVVPPLVKETIDFVRDIPNTLSSLNDSTTTLGRLVDKYGLQENVDGLTQNIKDRTQNIQEPVLSTATRVGAGLLSLFTVLVLTFMFLVEGPEWAKKFWQLHPKERREHNKQLAQRMYRIVTGYVNGQVLIAAIAAMFAFVTLVIASTLFGVTVNAIALSGIVFLFGLIPLIGNTLAAGLVVLVCLFASPGLALVMFIYFLIYQQVENVTLQPYIQAKNNELTPLLVFIAALIGAGFGGILGAFVAIPAAGCGKILLLDYLERHDISKI